MIKHDEFKSKLQDYLEKILPEQERQELALHLVDCAECQRELDALKDLVRCLETLPEQEPPNELTELIMRQVRTDSINVFYWDIIKSWLPKLGYAYAIGLGLVCISGYITYRYISEANLSLLKIFNQTIIFISNGIAKLSELGLGLWIASSSLIRYGLPTISSCLIIETMLIIVGIYYWYLRKHKAIHLIVLN
jgi:hypothetical protein